MTQNKILNEWIVSYRVTMRKGEGLCFRVDATLLSARDAGALFGARRTPRKAEKERTERVIG